MADFENQEEYVRLKKTDFQKICQTIASLKKRITELESIYATASIDKK